ncbi:MAG: hypothetical protein PHS44_00640 [Candidatus Dojkabacteria bacterium]|nr:hypothetical protein [Candidatus Dojkabacteria bacterium]
MKKKEKKYPKWVQPIVDRAKIIGEWVRETFTGSLTEEEHTIIQEQYVFVVNVFLRHIPVEERGALVNRLVAMSSKFAKWDNPGTDAAGTIHSIFGVDVKYSNIRSRRQVMHEAIHILQSLELMPQNNALTFAITTVQELMEKPQELVDSDQAFGYIIERFGTRDAWFALVKAGHTDQGLKLGKRISENPEMALFVRFEPYFNRLFGIWGERIENVKGIKSPYNVMANVGGNRGIRAFALGYFSGDMDLCYDLLWLHSLGYDFDQCERFIVEQVETGNSLIYRGYPELKPEHIL